jgi:hypothetical protein
VHCRVKDNKPSARRAENNDSLAVAMRKVRQSKRGCSGRGRRQTRKSSKSSKSKAAKSAKPTKLNGGIKLKEMQKRNEDVADWYLQVQEMYHKAGKEMKAVYKQTVDAELREKYLQKYHKYDGFNYNLDKEGVPDWIYAIPYPQHYK